MLYYVASVLFLPFVCCPCIAINVSVQYNGGLCLSTLLETVSYAWELTSVSMCYSQGDGFNTFLSRLFYLILYTQSVVNYRLCVCLC